MSRNAFDPTVTADGGDSGEAVELRGLEPLTFALPVATLSQLSYSPSEVVIIGQVNACALIVARKRQPQLDHLTRRDDGDRDEEAAVKFPAVDRQKIYVALVVRRVDVAARE